jgi:hypothetical protein
VPVVCVPSVPRSGAFCFYFFNFVLVALFDPFRDWWDRSFAREGFHGNVSGAAP